MSPTRPLVSFVLLSYKQESFIREAVEGAFSQTYSPLEIIISDDCSPDGTFDIIREMAAAYQGPHKVIINRNETNLGLGAHVGKVFGMATGEWVVGAAGDDISLPQRCEVLITAALEQGSNCHGIASDWISINDSGVLIEGDTNSSQFLRNQKQHGHITGIAACKQVLVDRTNQLPGCSSMWKTSLFKDWPPLLPGLCWEDQTLSCRAHLAGTLHFVDDRLVRYRTSAGAMTNVSEDPNSIPAEIKRKRKARDLATIRARQRGIEQFFLDLEHWDPSGRRTGSYAADLQSLRSTHSFLESSAEWHQLSLTHRMLRWISGRRHPF